MSRIYIATTNAGKLRELRALCAPLGWEPLVYDGYVAPPEGERSYADNAALKARALAERLRVDGIAAAALGDDSGLEVNALDGRPGVLSARYGGAETPWPQRRAMLLAEVAASGAVDRGARFVCALHLVASDGREHAVLETVEGRIPLVERGAAGFSYDPIFEYPPLGRTFGELSEEEKNAVSHRTRALRALFGEISRGLGAKEAKTP